MQVTDRIPRSSLSPVQRSIKGAQRTATATKTSLKNITSFYVCYFAIFFNSYKNGELPKNQIGRRGVPVRFTSRSPQNLESGERLFFFDH